MGASLMKRPPLDQSTAAPAAATTARRMSVPPATPFSDSAVKLRSAGCTGRRLFEKKLDLAKELHPVLLHDDRVRPLSNLDEPLVGCAGQPLEISEGHVCGKILVPVAVNEEGRRGNPRRIVIRLPGRPELLAVGNDTVGRAQFLRVFARSYGIGGKRCLCPLIEPPCGDQFRFLRFRHSLEPALPRR